ncbi:MAG: hypothetical protein GF344_16490 [Chitinivibrionales bacterium]|nr:hypothetical protein [Chitinivibrionales bacterium]MBD3358292.1 hypothetical protein [Chitinivibrionales bacterium]
MTDLAKLNRNVVFGQSGGKIIWQPRIGCWYNDKKFAKEPLPEPYEGKNVHEIHRAMGISSRLYTFRKCFKRIEDSRVNRTSKQINDTDTEIRMETPVGTQITVTRRSANSYQAITVKWEVESEEELKVATWREENTSWEWDQEAYDELIEKIGDLGAPTIFMPRMNIQSLYIEKMGVEKGVFALYEMPDSVDAYFKALHESHDRLIDVINESPIEIINFGENVHAGTLSPDLFTRYHLPECQHRCERLHGAGKFVSSHWDGDTGPLLKYAQETGLDGIEAITPKPQGDVTLEEMKEALGNSMFLLDGIPAVYFDETYSIDTLKECVHKLIDLFAPKLVLGISDELSSTGNIERLRIVDDIVNEYNAKC